MAWGFGGRAFGTGLVGMIVAATLFAESQAAELRDFVGTWVGQRTEFVNGQAFVFSQRVTYRLFGNDLRVETEIRTGKRRVKGNGTYSENGKYDASLMRGSLVLAVSSGTWQFSGSTLRVNAVTNQAGGRRTRTTATTRFVNPRKLVTVSNSPQGSVALTLRRVR